MSSLDTHRENARTFKKAADAAEDPGPRVEMWFLSAYHLIEACAAKHRVHIQKHQRVPDELTRNPVIFGPRTSDVVVAFRYLDHDARAKFVYGAAGSAADLKRAEQSFSTIESICLEALG